jgi:hypothetical protein
MESSKTEVISCRIHILAKEFLSGNIFIYFFVYLFFQSFCNGRKNEAEEVKVYEDLR